MNSITYRINGLMFLLVGLTVVILVYLAEAQMTGLFHEYLTANEAYGPGGLTGAEGIIMGLPEQVFLASVHRSLIWVGLALIVAAFGASFALARSITIPLRKLATAVEQIEKGNFEQHIAVESQDEVGHLAMAINRMNDALNQNNRLRQRLLADVAHELRTPLSVIQGNLEGMLEGVVDINQTQLSSLYDETVHLNRLIKDLRDLSLAEAGQLLLERQLTDINQLIDKVVHMLEPQAEEKAIVFANHLQPVPAVLVDAGRINQILYNLLTNALRHTPRQGQISITTALTTEAGQQWLKVTVADNGTGISAEDLPFIFNHFYRADKARDRRSGGSGIGLAIVKQLADVHGGKVTVESTRGLGSSFAVYLPVA
ncbi:HAMP domain-containing histidine kinase|uniref:histidine kinase n=1 Tax=Dendrosporobacter quercicolus TaxID=146817 RepID=A0A1G9QH11_9FIRM|nr:HAMP domain-containing sensor histidine kinase [Dendrosporobacter quercicolus]NSL48241.1 HAMP domain-containing histidine kinase [Dendrosporobacter quercicolus DSM 1736]SDM10273.1 Signal transduction histidine kinase [Dendrosporobacter quercicolus]